MPKVTVTIVEEVVEKRTYVVEVPGPDTADVHEVSMQAMAAAKLAHELWINQGIEPVHGVVSEVNERYYEMITDVPAEMGGTLAFVFDESDVTQEDDE